MFLKTLVLEMVRSSAGREFHDAGPEKEKARSPNNRLTWIDWACRSLDGYYHSTVAWWRNGFGVTRDQEVAGSTLWWESQTRHVNSAIQHLIGVIRLLFNEFNLIIFLASGIVFAAQNVSKSIDRVTGLPKLLIISPQVRKRSIVISVSQSVRPSLCPSVCLSVCALAYLKNHKFKLHEIFVPSSGCNQLIHWAYRPLSVY